MTKTSTTPPHPTPVSFLSVAPTCLDTLSHPERPRQGRILQPASRSFLVSVQTKTVKRRYVTDSRLMQQLCKFIFRRRCSEKGLAQRCSRLCLRQRCSFSRCWSSSLLACCSLPQLQPSQQPQLLPIWRPAKKNSEERSPRVKMAPRLRLRAGSDAYAGHFYSL